MDPLDHDTYLALLRQDLHAFAQRSFLALNPQTPFHDNWHLQLLAAKLEACRVGRIRRLIINVPPRSMKSILASVAFPAWVLGRDPSRRLIAASYGYDLSIKHAIDCRSVMDASFYRQAFPATLIDRRRQAPGDFMTTEGGGRLATSVGGVLTGRGADFLIIDDPLKPEEALSDVRREPVNTWFDHTLLSRLDDKARGGIIVIMQRLHLDDLVGHLIEQGGWELVKLPAIATEDEVHTIDTPYGSYTKRRSTGEALHPQRESLETLTVLRQAMGEFAFAGQYQQDPVPLGGGMIKTHWFKRYRPEEFPAEGRRIQSWDTAAKNSELADYSVCTSWIIDEPNIYLADVYRARVNYPELKRAVHDQARRFGPETILIEDKSSGTQLIQELQTEGITGVQGIKPEGDKIMRLHAQTAMIENGFVYLPEAAAWLAEYLHELTSFPKAKYVDQVDSTAQALAWISSARWQPGSGILEFYRRLYEEKARAG